MPLDTQFQAIVDAMAQMPALYDMPLQDLRGVEIPVDHETHPVDSVEDRTIAGPGGDLRLRIYRNARDDEPPPVLLFMHGGGFVVGGLDTHDEMARLLTRATGCITVSVDYRLAPENPYPAAPDDCLAALRWTAAHAGKLGADPGRLVVIGDSAGGNLAAVTALRARDERGPAIAAQVLIYPVADVTAPVQPAPDGNFYILNPELRRFFTESYLGGADPATLPYLSPGTIEDLSGLPPTLLITGEYDPLCAQGETLAGRYREAGVDTAHTCYAGAIHGFMTFPTPMREQAFELISNWLEEKLS